LLAQLRDEEVHFVEPLRTEVDPYATLDVIDPLVDPQPQPVTSTPQESETVNITIGDLWNGTTREGVVVAHPLSMGSLGN
jgi:hypothetical protein